MPTSTRGRDPAVEEEFLGALYKGGELLASGKIVEAREHLERAHGLAPRNEKAQNLLGLTYFKLGLYEQAAEVYEKLVDDNPADATLRVNLGLVFLKTNNLERCVREFETATDLEPTHKKAHNYLGLALAQQGDYAKAREHFTLAGSDAMAEKMGRAIAAQSTPSGMAPPAQRAQTVVLGDGPAEVPRPPPPVDDEAIEVMSDEELPSDAYVVPEEIVATPADPVQETPSGLTSIDDDWGAQLPAEPSSTDEMRFAEDEGPSEATLLAPQVEELPVLEGELAVDVEAAPSSVAPAWLTMEAAEAAHANDELPEGSWQESRAPKVPVAADAQWVQEPSVDDAPAQPVEEHPAVGEHSFEAAHEGSFSREAPVSSESSGWATEQIEGVYPTPAPQPAPVDVPIEPESVPVALQEVALEPVPAGDWAVEPISAQVEDSSWATEPTPAQPAEVRDASSTVSEAGEAGAFDARADESAVSKPAGPELTAGSAVDAVESSDWSNAAQQEPTADSGDDVPLDATTDGNGWSNAAQPETTPDDPSWATGEASDWSNAAQPEASSDDASWATGAQAGTNADGSDWSNAAQPMAASGDDVQLGETTDGSDWSNAAQPEASSDDASWATVARPGTSDWSNAAPPETSADDRAWATAGVPADDSAWSSAAQPDATGGAPSWTADGQAYPPERASEDNAWATGPAAQQYAAADDGSWPASAAAQPYATTDATNAPADEASTWDPPAGPPAGYAPMNPQRLVDLGASGAWVAEPSAGPFHIGADGLAVTVAGEMLSRLDGLVAITGSVEVTPEHKRRRGRSASETFGADGRQLQRLKGNGVVYLESGKASFHAVDLTDQNGVSIDDDGAYLREELVFAFEEPIFFENGKLSSDGQELPLVHLKGNGRVLLQLEGSLRAMPIPTGAPLVVPLQRVVGWFGRVTPRLKGFGGRGAIELTGEGYALLGAVAERS